MEYSPNLNYDAMLVTFYDNKPNHSGDEDLQRYIECKNILEVQNTQQYDQLDLNKYAYTLLYQERSRIVKESVTQKELSTFFRPVMENNPYFFVTINYPKECEEYEQMKQIVTNINNLDWIESIEYVFEYHTKSGGHPHCHMLITTKEKMPPSKVLDKIFIVKGLRKLIPGKQSVDLAKNRDKTLQHYRDYINGAKTESKTENCFKDQEWRIKNNLNT